MDQEITLYIFNISQMDMASRRFIVSTRETKVSSSLFVGGIRNQAFRIPKIKECLSLPKSPCERPSRETPGALESFFVFQNSSFGSYPSLPAEPSNELRITQGVKVSIRSIVFLPRRNPKSDSCPSRQSRPGIRLVSFVVSNT
jgi:hypothetical protein